MGAELAAGFDCRVCGSHHETLPLSFSARAPHAVANIPAWQWEQRLVLTRDQCVIEGKHFYLRGRIVVPLHDFDQPYVWGVWAQVSAKDFYRAHREWNTPGRERGETFAGWLATEIPLFCSTLGLELEIHTQIVGRRPHFLLCSGQHPLAAEQRRGMSLARAEEIASQLLHAVVQDQPLGPSKVSLTASRPARRNMSSTKSQEPVSC